MDCGDSAAIRHRFGRSDLSLRNLPRVTQTFLSVAFTIPQPAPQRGLVVSRKCYACELPAQPPELQRPKARGVEEVGAGGVVPGGHAGAHSVP